MNEKQLKEIAILAKELGFKPCTMTTRFSFDELVGIKSNTSLVTDTCYYLLLCEIQLWLIIEYKKYITVSSDHACIIEDSFFPVFDFDLIRSLNTDLRPHNLYKTYQDALATGILEGLKLIKNENN